jgi:hypothetical protein
MKSKTKVASGDIVKKMIVEETDLRDITRDSKRLVCTVTIDLGWAEDGRTNKLCWLRFGQVQIRKGHKAGEYRLEAHLKDNACDLEHDTAYAVRLPLVGLQLDDLVVNYSQTHFVAWVNPDVDEGFSDFHVPRPGYNPMKHEDAWLCDGIYDEKKKKYCKWNEGKPHVILPEGFHVPPFDKELYRAVRGKKVEIVVGPVLDLEEGE